MTNAEIAAAFDQIADLLELQGANQFRVRAYRNAARTIRELPEPLAEIAADPERKLTDLEGIGKDLAEKIATLLDTGSLPMLEELSGGNPGERAGSAAGAGPGTEAGGHPAPRTEDRHARRTPRGLREPSRPRTERLRREDRRPPSCKGWKSPPRRPSAMLWAEADQHAQEILAHMRGVPGRRAGSRRPAATAAARRPSATWISWPWPSDAAAVMDRLAAYGAVAEVLARGETKMSVRLGSGLQVDLRVVPAESFGAALQYFTGSKEHNIVLRGLAKDRGLKINEYGVFRGEKSIAGRTEEDVYAALDLPCFPPELREARREFDWARAGHSCPRWSSSTTSAATCTCTARGPTALATIEEMAAAAKARGLQYIAMTDHSKRVSMAGGLDAERLRQQWAEIDKLNRAAPAASRCSRASRSISSNAAAWTSTTTCWPRPTGSWPASTTARTSRASRSPAGWSRPWRIRMSRPSAHPTGRMLNKRRPYEIDMDAVMKAAREHGKMLELNAHPVAAGPGRRGLRGGEEPRHSRGDFHRCASRRGAWRPCVTG